MTEITEHRGNLLNNAIEIHAEDAGPGGAPSVYRIYVEESDGPASLTLRFQQGDPADDINGITNEVLLAVLQHRLTGFQNGKFPSRENALALENVSSALALLKQRSVSRTERGVEGRQIA